MTRQPLWWIPMLCLCGLGLCALACSDDTSSRPEPDGGGSDPIDGSTADTGPNPDDGGIVFSDSGRRDTGSPRTDGRVPPPDAEPPCTSSADCMDSDSCTVNERCEGGACVADVFDADGDGEPGGSCGGLDCDDEDASIHPDAAELCDDIDNDCNGLTDGAAANADCDFGEECVDGACEPPPSSCNLGTACTLGSCTDGECITEMSGMIGGSGDEIVGHPGGDTSVPVVDWQDGYCTPQIPSTAMPFVCDPTDPLDTTCGACGQCVDLGDSAMCLRGCTRSEADNDLCRDGYACELTTSSCLPGCATDDECRVYREDTNDDGVIDPYDASTNPDGDRLVYDVDSDATCDLDTYRCTHSGAADAEAGDACDKHSDCEADGFCVLDGWSDGYCSKFGCDVTGRECAGSGTCNTTRFGIALCAASCTVGETSTADDDFTHAAGCRPDYTCTWDRISTGPSGLCIPGNYNDVRTPNVGASCTAEEDCYSPFGLGDCFDEATSDFPGGYCLVHDCGAPGYEGGDMCGSDGVCVDFGEGISVCLDLCATADDCRAGYDCISDPGASDTFCWPTA